MQRNPLLPATRRKAQRGIALIEAMVGIVIFAIGVLGLVGLQAAMTRTQSTAKFRGDAAYLANELIGTMWGDPANLASYATATCTGYTRCNDWKNKVGTLLPGGTAAVTVASGGVVTIVVSWTTPNDGTNRYTTTTAIQL